MKIVRLLPALALLAGCAAAPGKAAAPSFWSQLQAREHGTGEYLFDSLDQLTPGAAERGPFKPAAALVEGTVTGVEPGIAYASNGDSEVNRVVPYDSEEAAIRWAHVVVKVDKIVAGKLGRGYAAGQIRVKVEQPLGTTLEGLRQSLGTAGRGLFFVENSLDRRNRTARTAAAVPQQAQARLAAVHLPIGQGIFIEESKGAALIAPLADEERAAQLLGGNGMSLKSAGAAPLDQLRAHLQDTACKSGTANDKSAC